MRFVAALALVALSGCAEFADGFRRGIEEANARRAAQPPPIYCTTNRIGNTYFTNCYQ